MKPCPLCAATTPEERIAIVTGDPSVRLCDNCNAIRRLSTAPRVVPRGALVGLSDGNQIGGMDGATVEPWRRLTLGGVEIGVDAPPVVPFSAVEPHVSFAVDLSPEQRADLDAFLDRAK